MFIGRTDAETEVPILWPPDEKSWLIGKDPDARKDWAQEEKRATEDEMVGWHHWLNGHEFAQTLEDSERQGSLVCYSPWGHKELGTPERLNNNQRMSWKLLFSVFCLGISLALGRRVHQSLLRFLDTSARCDLFSSGSLGKPCISE